MVVACSRRTSQRGRPVRHPCPQGSSELIPAILDEAALVSASIVSRRLTVLVWQKRKGPGLLRGLSHKPLL
jgi:hypothetical protein